MPYELGELRHSQLGIWSSWSSLISPCRDESFDPKTIPKSPWFRLQFLLANLNDCISLLAQQRPKICSSSVEIRRLAFPSCSLKMPYELGELRHSQLGIWSSWSSLISQYRDESFNPKRMQWAVSTSAEHIVKTSYATLAHWGQRERKKQRTDRQTEKKVINAKSDKATWYVTKLSQRRDLYGDSSLLSRVLHFNQLAIYLAHISGRMEPVLQLNT